MERLQKVMAECGVASRRKSEELIKQKRVKVNGQVIDSLGHKVSSKDKIEVDETLIHREDKVYYLLNKPRGIITTTSDDKCRKTVTELIDTDKRIYPVGRLDYDTTGVLLLTNDGEFANIIMHPSDQIDKVYMAKVKGIVKGEAIERLKKGVQVDDHFCKADRVKLRKVDYDSNSSMVEVTIHEGRNHQVKKMFEAVGFDVLKLKRERVGIFDLKGLPSGKYRKLTPKEVQKVYSLTK